jgi:hypothetical protein
MSLTPPSPDLRAAAPDYARRFADILTYLRAAIAHGLLRHPLLIPIITPLCSRLARAARRFDRLMAHIAAGRLPQPRPGSHSGPTRPKLPIPTNHGWLLRALRHHVAVYGSQLQELLTRPGMAELLATSPAARRIFRPLMHMLGFPDPAPRPRPARKPRAPRPRAAATVGPLRSPTPPCGGLGGKADRGAGAGSATTAVVPWYADPASPNDKPRAASPPRTSPALCPVGLERILRVFPFSKKPA